MRYFLDISYKGTAYHGWQNQPNALSVQEVLEQKMSLLLKHHCDTLASGRTDAGVHALQQYVHFDTEVLLNDNFVYRLNKMLPTDIAVNALYAMQDQAHARFDAISRSYQYHIHTHKHAFNEHRSLFFPKALNLDALNEASALLLGKQDFTSFSKVHTDVYNFNCDIQKAYWVQHENNVVFHITGNRFLRGMVRAIVGTLLEIGTGNKPVAWMKEVIDAQNRSCAGVAVLPHGLYLCDIAYPEHLFVKKINHES